MLVPPHLAEAVPSAQQHSQKALSSNLQNLRYSRMLCAGLLRRILLPSKSLYSLLIEIKTAVKLEVGG
ncbi:hypothetical protein D9M68_949940 [compost metagenome]